MTTANKKHANHAIKYFLLCYRKHSVSKLLTCPLSEFESQVHRGGEFGVEVRVEAGAEGLAQAKGQFAGIAEADEGHQVLVERKFSVHLAQQHGHCQRVHSHVAAPCGFGTARRGVGGGSTRSAQQQWVINRIMVWLVR